MENELKPCPFCGGEAEIYGDLVDGYSVQCASCFSGTAEFEGVRGNYEQTATSKAIAAWNTRAHLNYKRDIEPFALNLLSKIYDMDIDKCAESDRDIIYSMQTIAANIAAKLKERA